MCWGHWEILGKTTEEGTTIRYEIKGETKSTRQMKDGKNTSVGTTMPINKIKRLVKGSLQGGIDHAFFFPSSFFFFFFLTLSQARSSYQEIVWASDLPRREIQVRDAPQRQEDTTLQYNTRVCVSSMDGQATMGN